MPTNLSTQERVACALDAVPETTGPPTIWPGCDQETLRWPTDRDASGGTSQDWWKLGASNVSSPELIAQRRIVWEIRPDQEVSDVCLSMQRNS